MKYFVTVDGREFEVVVDGGRVLVDGQEFEAHLGRSPGHRSVTSSWATSRSSLAIEPAGRGSWLAPMASGGRWRWWTSAPGTSGR